MKNILSDLDKMESKSCLYCKSVALPVAVKSEWSSNKLKVSKTWCCQTCSESFTFTGLEDEDPDSMQFQCKDIKVFVHYKTNNVLLQNKLAEPVWLPKFEMDFSDKEKLYNKLRTYLIFS